MKKNLRITLLLSSVLFLLGCGKNNSKAITIEQGTSLIDACLEKDKAAPLIGTAFSFKSTISVPSVLQADQPYLFLEVIYNNAHETYSTLITRATAKSTDTYAITKADQDGATIYQVATNGALTRAYDPVNDAYLYNFFELPAYLLNENIYGLQSARTLLALVQSQSENKLTSYNLFSSGEGNLDMTLRGDGLDFISLFTETPQINSNVTSIHFVVENALLTSLEASYLVSAPATSSNSLSQQLSASSVSDTLECKITMDLTYQ